MHTLHRIEDSKMPKKRSTTPKNGNNSKALIKDSVIESTIAGAYVDEQDDRPRKLVSNLILGCSFQDAAAKAGYSKQYARGNLYTAFKNSARFRRVIDSITGKLPERYRQICRLRLGQVAEIERKALDTYLQNPELAIQKPKLMRDIKIAAGALSEDFGETGVQYANFQVIVGQVISQPRTHGQFQLTDNQDIIDCEVNDEQ